MDWKIHPYTEVIQFGFGLTGADAILCRAAARVTSRTRSRAAGTAAGRALPRLSRLADRQIALLKTD